jgi:hypothetical protein
MEVSMRNVQIWTMAALLGAMAVPSMASAQIAERAREQRRDMERRERTEQQRRSNDRYDQRYDRRYDDRYDRSRPGRASGGPVFCRNGSGHPVHGRRWCADKGFGLGGRYGYDDRNWRWERERWRDVTFRMPRTRDRGWWNSAGYLDDRAIVLLLGDGVYGRLVTHSRRLGRTAPLGGYWFGEDNARILTVYAGNDPLAELIDRNGDGRVEDVRLLRRR